MNSIEIKCEKPSCQNTVKINADAFFWSTRMGYEVREVSLRCAKCSEREAAPMIKPQPRRINTDPALQGWT